MWRLWWHSISPQRNRCKRSCQTLAGTSQLDTAGTPNIPTPSAGQPGRLCKRRHPTRSSSPRRMSCTSTTRSLRHTGRQSSRCNSSLCSCSGSASAKPQDKTRATVRCARLECQEQATRNFTFKTPRSDSVRTAKRARLRVSDVQRSLPDIGPSDMRHNRSHSGRNRVRSQLPGSGDQRVIWLATQPARGRRTRPRPTTFGPRGM